MKELRIPPAAQIVVLVVVLAAGLAGLVSQLPEIQRYLKVKRM